MEFYRIGELLFYLQTTLYNGHTATMYTHTMLIPLQSTLIPQLYGRNVDNTAVIQAYTGVIQAHTGLYRNIQVLYCSN